MYPVESKVLIKGEDKFLCHVYSYNNDWFAFVDSIGEKGREWANGEGQTHDQAIHDGINKIYEMRKQNEGY